VLTLLGLGSLWRRRRDYMRRLGDSTGLLVVGPEACIDW
jgi:hypothetical protein